MNVPSRPVRVTLGLVLLAAGAHAAASRPESVAPAQQVACAPDPATHGSDQSVGASVNALLASLSPGQKVAMHLPFNRDNALRWSNLPVTAVPRIGVRLGDLDATQTALARALVKAATSSCGLKMFDDVRASDDFIAPVAALFGWGSPNFYIAVLGQPSQSAPWMLKIGGHHLAYNFVFNGHLPGATPLFTGTEPIRFTVGGSEHEPLRDQSQAMSALARAIATYPEARLEGRFTDVVKGVEVSFPKNGPPIGGNDTAFPTTYPTGTKGRGVAYARLSPDQQRLVRQAIETYAALPGGAIAHGLLADYEGADHLADTYVGYSNAPDLSMDGSYVRIDGPRAWMEFVVQPGVAYPQKLHYHALWRDKAADYGGEFNR